MASFQAMFISLIQNGSIKSLSWQHSFLDKHVACNIAKSYDSMLEKFIR